MDEGRERMRGQLRDAAEHAANLLCGLGADDGWLYRYTHFDTKTAEFTESVCLTPNMAAAKQFAETLRTLAQTVSVLYPDEAGGGEETGVILLSDVKEDGEDDAAEDE